MTTRQQRRRAAREAAKNPRHGKSEVFSYTDEEGNEEWLAVEPLRLWAEENQALVGVDLDMQKVEQILNSGRVSKEHVMQHTISQDVRPVIVALDYEEGHAEIVDGNHTYIAMAVAAAKAQEMGLMLPPIRTKSIDEKEFIILLDQGMKAFQNNTNMTDQETFGAIGTLTSAADMIRRAKDKQILP